MADATLRGRFVWHELMTTDTKSAAGFFTTVVGWKVQPSEQDPSYTMFVAGGRPMAGLMALPPDAKAGGAPPSWLTYIGTPDLDATVRDAAAAGGKILKAATVIPDVGRFAVLQDPQGAVFAVFTPNGPAPTGVNGLPAVGDFSWHELATTDWRAALAFYQRLFGWELTSAMDMGPGMGTYQMYGLKGQPMGGIFDKPSQMPGPPAWLPYIKVGNSKTAAAAITKLGGRIVHGPEEVPGGDLIVQAFDLQGGMFALHSAKAAARRAAARAASPSARGAGKRKGAGARTPSKAAGGRPRKAAGGRPRKAVGGRPRKAAGGRKKTAAGASGAGRRKASSSRGRRRR
jgi:predicted enzyme related to lactoylglutathione lyase